MSYRIWADGREFGLDYSLMTARRIAMEYSLMWPGIRYVVRDRLGRFA